MVVTVFGCKHRGSDTVSLPSCNRLHRDFVRKEEEEEKE